MQPHAGLILAFDRHKRRSSSRSWSNQSTLSQISEALQEQSSVELCVSEQVSTTRAFNERDRSATMAFFQFAGGSEKESTGTDAATTPATVVRGEP